MLREFSDNNGVVWRVWNVDPTTPHVPKVKQRRKSQPVQGWLVFESPTERRRLSPIPEDWTDVDAAALAELCGRADVVPHIARNFSPRKS